MKVQKDGIRIRVCLAPVVCYLFLWVLLFCWYLFLQSHLLMTTLVVMVVLPVCSIVSAWQMHPYLSVSVYSVQPVMQEGQEGVWCIRLNNDSYGLALSSTVFGTVGNTFLGTSGEISVKMPISMKYTERMDLPFMVQYCGLVKVEITALEYRDPMGLIRIRLPLQASAESVVLPDRQSEMEEHRDGFQAGISEAEETLSKGYDFAEVTDMREYRPGDRIKDIHWKLSAKKQDLMVKERTSVAQSQVILLLDFSYDEYEMVSAVAGLAYGVTKSFLETYVPVRLLWWDQQNYDFNEIVIAGEDALEDGFGKMLHSRICRVGQNLPELMQRIRPTLQSYVYLHEIQGKADGEVISHV
ncbi:MAG: DUF58 domain-containing protein [Lachnospiraceae bacterium]|nr:DUF58 domain-containing protein [Lachnospiraceae bacterium]